MAKYLYRRKKYEIERLLERATIGLRSQHPDCDKMQFGEVERNKNSKSRRDTWTATVSGGSKAGRDKFEAALDYMIKTNEFVD